jgi:Fe-S cluster assembly iron-binding protein IscA
VGVEITARALEVLRRALELGRMNPAQVAIRVTVSSDRGGEARTTFADELEPDETTVELSGIRLYVPTALAERGATIDVSDEHDKIVVR